MKKVNTAFFTSTGKFLDNGYSRRSRLSDLILQAREEEKREKRNTVYKVCGAVIVLVVSVMLVSL